VTCGGEDPFNQDREPVITPEGFARPRFKIGQRVRVAMSSLAPVFQTDHEGLTGTVARVIFCRSDRHTVLYAVRYDPRPGLTVGGGRWEGFELDALPD
jgi:hypothetical protein